MKKALSFKRVFKEGRYLKGNDFSLRVIENNLAVSRLGISIQARFFPNATQRNRVKRLIREVFRRNKYRVAKSYDIIIRPKNTSLYLLGYNQIEKAILDLFAKAGILTQIPGSKAVE